MLQLRIVGNGVDVSRTLAPGDPPLIIGRDGDCHLCLPDPERNVSRRHLGIWNEGDVLHFQVLSVVNGVEGPTGEVQPGMRGMLHIGEVVSIGSYALTVHELPVPQPDDGDPWAVLERESSGSRTPAYEATRPGGAIVDDDPFTQDWGFDSGFGTDPGIVPITPQVEALLRGLGLTPGQLSGQTEAEIEGIGRVARALAVGMLALHQRIGAPSVDPALNPLKSSWPLEAKLQYLFALHDSAGGVPVAEAALRELIADLQALLPNRGIEDATRK